MPGPCWSQIISCPVAFSGTNAHSLIPRGEGWRPDLKHGRLCVEREGCRLESWNIMRVGADYFLFISFFVCVIYPPYYFPLTEVALSEIWKMNRDHTHIHTLHVFSLSHRAPFLCKPRACVQPPTPIYTLMDWPSTGIQHNNDVFCILKYGN